MPTVHEERGCRWKIYIHDHPPPHAHVEVGDGVVIVNLDDDASIRSVSGKVGVNDQRKVQKLTLKNLPKLQQAWEEIHGS